MRDETKCLHSGYTPKNGEPRVLPIVQSTTYVFDSTEHIGQLFDMPTEFMYSRFANPTVDAVEKKIADLEGGVGAMCTSSGQAASLFSILNLCKAGDSFVSTSTIYGGTVNLFAVTLKNSALSAFLLMQKTTKKRFRRPLSRIPDVFSVKHWQIRRWQFWILRRWRRLLIKTMSL